MIGETFLAGGSRAFIVYFSMCEEGDVPSIPYITAAAAADTVALMAVDNIAAVSVTVVTVGDGDGVDSGSACAGNVWWWYHW